MRRALESLSLLLRCVPLASNLCLEGVSFVRNNHCSWQFFTWVSGQLAHFFEMMDIQLFYEFYDFILMAFMTCQTFIPLISSAVLVSHCIFDLYESNEDEDM